NVLFIKADREYREGKAQNHLRPEDIDKVVHAYRAGQDIDGYAKRVPVADIKAEDYNCNIRRYVDNAPPPEPHDVRAHLHGGIPKREVDALERFWTNYPDLRKRCFRRRPGANSYLDFTAQVTDRRALADIVNGDASVRAAHARFLATLEDWWQAHLPHVEALAPDNGRKGNVYELRRLLMNSIEQALADQTLLTEHQVRGGLARYFDFFKPEFK